MAIAEVASGGTGEAEHGLSQWETGEVGGPRG
jgi:hypothetical protein